MNDEKEILRKQLELLAEASKKSTDYAEGLAALSAQMVNIVTLLATFPAETLGSPSDEEIKAVVQAMCDKPREDQGK